MAVFRWGQAWDAFRDLEREVDRLLAGVTLSIQGIRHGRPYPALNVYEYENELILTAELPGTRPDELELTVAGGVLTLSGRRSGPEGVPDEAFRRQERLRGPWKRQLALPDRILEEQLSAEFSHGVLTIRLPKAQAATPRQIPVGDGSSSLDAPIPATAKHVGELTKRVATPQIEGPVSHSGGTSSSSFTATEGTVVDVQRTEPTEF